MATRRYGTLIRHLREDPDTARELAERLPEELLAHLAAALRDEQQRRALDDGDRDAVIEEGFRSGFGRDGLATAPWIHAPFVVCPGGLVGKNKGSHRCRFVSIDDCWVWESGDLIQEDKRSTPGTEEGFRAVALVPVVEGMGLDVVSGRMRSGQHSVEKVVSFEIRRGALVEVGQRNVKASGLR